jgi:hypothetical protein
MRLRLMVTILVFSPWHIFGQGTPPPVVPGSDNEAGRHDNATGSLPDTPEPKLERMKTMIKKEVRKEVENAINQNSPALQQWHPLTSGQKFRLFLKRTGSPRTFAGAAVDAAADKWENDNREYARGFPGYSQHYAVELATGESDAFFSAFLIPTVLKQDPRYFRNPNLPFLKRTLYSLSRVVITRNDRGHQTFNSSYVVGSAASQALADIYIPGHAQGLHPIADRLTFNLARDAGFNLLHEFWPELRRKFLHR